jgi:hypothetical protein
MASMIVVIVVILIRFPISARFFFCEFLARQACATPGTCNATPTKVLFLEFNITYVNLDLFFNLGRFLLLASKQAS